MKKIYFILIGIIVIVLIIVGINIFGNLQKVLDIVEPEIREVSLSWGRVTGDTTEIQGIIKVFNPNSVPIPITNISCDIMIDDIKIGSGETIGLQIEENTEFPVEFSAIFDNKQFASVWTEHIRRNETSEVTIKLGITVDLGVGTVTLPYTINQPIETDILMNLKDVLPATVEKKINVPLLGEKTIFEISFEGLSGDWGTITSQVSQINLSATITNKNSYPLLAPKVKCTIESNGLTLAYGETGLVNTIAPNSTKEFEFVATLNTSLMDEWFVQHIRQGERSQFDIRVFMGFEVNEEILGFLGSDDLTITLWEDSQVIETDILNQR